MIVVNQSVTNLIINTVIVAKPKFTPFFKIKPNQRVKHWRLIMCVWRTALQDWIHGLTAQRIERDDQGAFLRLRRSKGRPYQCCEYDEKQPTV